MILIYDDTFEGFLSVVFQCYAQKLNPQNICSELHMQDVLFADKEVVATNEEHASRVWAGLQRKLTSHLDQVPYSAFLSRDEGIEMGLLRFVQLAFASPVPIEGNFGDPDVLTVRKAARKVMKEAMRMLEFIRFQRTLDDIYFAPISPDYDVLPLILRHFTSRFADQQWVIYDLKRDYGFHFNKLKLEEITLNEKNFNIHNGEMPENMLQEDEAFYQSAWKGYCKHITIRERINPKLHKQHMPKRYWKFLPEKTVKL